MIKVKTDNNSLTIVKMSLLNVSNKKFFLINILYRERIESCYATIKDYNFFF